MEVSQDSSSQRIKGKSRFCPRAERRKRELIVLVLSRLFAAPFWTLDQNLFTRVETLRGLATRRGTASKTTIFLPRRSFSRRTFFSRFGTEGSGNFAFSLSGEQALSILNQLPCTALHKISYGGCFVIL